MEAQIKNLFNFLILSFIFNKLSFHIAAALLPKQTKSSGSCITQEGRDDTEPELSSALLIIELTVKNKSTE